MDSQRPGRSALALVSRAFLVPDAEGVGFEPTETRNASPVFKTGYAQSLTCGAIGLRTSLATTGSGLRNGQTGRMGSGLSGVDVLA